ncbi:MAG: hypothetical protein R3E68_22070 [Burkholderiaceae bacterium]
MRDVLGEIVKQGNRIDARSATELYEHHLVASGARALPVLAVRGGMTGILEQVDAALEDTAQGTASYAATIESFAQGLTDEQRRRVWASAWIVCGRRRYCANRWRAPASSCRPDARPAALTREN